MEKSADQSNHGEIDTELKEKLDNICSLIERIERRIDAVDKGDQIQKLQQIERALIALSILIPDAAEAEIQTSTTESE